MYFKHVRKRKKLQPFVGLCLWTILMFVLSFLWYGISVRLDGKKVLVREVGQVTSTEETTYRGNNVATYIELLRMPPETVFETIRVMIVNKENDSIYYEMKDFEEVRKKIEDEAYRGKILYMKAKNKDGYFVVLNELPLESYLYGVVPSEMPSAYPMEALKAQAICARTYAVLHMMNPAYPDYNAHVNDTTSYQVYHNIEEQETTNRAVDETRGKLLFQADGEQLVETFYYSTSCGTVTAASTNSEFEAYISQKNGSDFEVNESWYRWTYQIDNINNQNMLTRLKNRQKVGIGNVLTMTGNDVYENLSINELETIKDLFISKRGEGGVGAELMIHTAKNIYKVIGEYNIRYVLNDATISVVKQDNTEVKMATLLPSAFFSLDAIKKDNVVVGYEILGGGFGHGVGMSQNGAKAMANQGYTTEEILQYYYPNSLISEDF